MKNLKTIILTLTFFAFGIVMTSCGSNTNTNSSNKTEQQGKEYTSAYICPMHCKDSGSDQAGKCPVCGMDYVKNENHKADGHEGHSH